MPTFNSSFHFSSSSQPGHRTVGLGLPIPRVVSDSAAGCDLDDLDDGDRGNNSGTIVDGLENLRDLTGSEVHSLHLRATASQEIQTASQQDSDIQRDNTQSINDIDPGRNEIPPRNKPHAQHINNMEDWLGEVINELETQPDDSLP
ncbi:hypothetical protein VKT23_020611 [Stygiomarasmius scandens]|uniref:Uncharacterized protein n=1 Tax=Marasmiellus scandens TaxID=2682957 RepID=A0ABR1ILZ9_9AGAR